MIAIFLLVLVLIPGIGVERSGARRWFKLGFVHFQPSELAKLALIIFLAWYGEHYQRHMHTFTRGLLIPGLLIGLTAGLIFVEPDRGTAILLGAVAGIMLLVSGVRWIYLIPPGTVAAIGMALSLWFDDMRRARILSWWNLEQHKEGVGLQGYQAMLAFGAGGWNGLGLGNGRQKLGFVPEHHTDFIFSVIGEEMGFLATISVVLLFLVLVICGIYIACHSQDVFGMLLGSGLTFLIGLQAVINIGVVTGALPNKGLPLPFISYGGSNLLLMLTCIGLLVSIARHGVQATGESLNPFQRTKVVTV
jgi:cell division protein FtsW